jgi:hypothetical protein
LDELMQMSSDDDEDENGQDDLLMLAAIAKNIFDNPPGSDEDDDDDEPGEPDVVVEEEPPLHEEEDEGQDEDEPPPARPLTAPPGDRGFIFDGKLLVLPSVADGDSMAYRIEALRKYIEDGLGLDLFVEAYQFSNGGSDHLTAAETDVELRKLLSTPQQLAFYPLIEQLIVCEETSCGG